MTNRVMVVLTVDGLRARALGCYGNTWFDTPALDQLAGGGQVFDRVLAETTDLQQVFDALFSGRHTLDATRPSAETLLAELSGEGYLCHLVTDEPDLASRPEAADFDEVTVVSGNATERAAEVFDTSIGRTLEAAADVLGEWSAEYEQPRMLWVHLRGLMAPWDAPLELAESLVDEDDPELTVGVEVAHGEIERDEAGSDAAFLAGCRYAAQVMTLDRALGALDNLLAELWPESPASLVLAGTRGFALGEHGVLGLGEVAYRELLHVPLVVRSGGTPAMTREAGLLQTSDLATLLVQLAKQEPLAPLQRMVAVGRSGDSMYLETDDWSLVSEGEESPRLFVQPDDAWQANDVASLCRADVELLEALRTKIESAASSGAEWRQFDLATVAGDDAGG